MDESTRARMARVIQACSSLVDDGIEQPQKKINFSPLRDDIEVPARKKKRNRRPPASSLSLIEMRKKNESFWIDQKALPSVQQLLDDIEAEKDCAPLALMTPYSDAAWLATMWPCQRHEREVHHHQCSHECNRKLLHDGKDWYLWNDQIRRWELVDQLMYRLVAECCTLPYQRLNGISEDRLTLLSQNPNTAATEVELRKQLANCRGFHQHLERLHSLAYQKKVLAIAGQIFFSLPPLYRAGCWGPSRDILPLHDGTVLSASDGKRLAMPGDRLRSTTPTLPRTDPAFVPMEWMTKWRSKDLRQLQGILGHALLSLDEESSFRSLVLWGVDEETRHQFISFLRAVIGPHYCSFGVPNIHTRIAIETLVPRSEQHLLSSSFKQDLLTSLSCASDALKILIVGSVENRICAFPVDLPSHCIVLPASNVETIRTGDRFWGTATSLRLTHEEDSSTEIAVIDAEPLAWLINGIAIP